MKLKHTYALGSIAILGMISIILPIFMNPDIKQYESPLFPLIRTGIEGISMYSFIFLFFSGAIVNYFSDLSFWKIGLMSMALFPIATFCEMIADPSSHNMFPFEFIFYGIYTIPAITGAFFSDKLKGILQPKRTQ